MLYDANQIREFTEEEKAAIRAEAGLDKTLPEQYIDWIGGVLQGDLGQSILLRTSVTDDILNVLYLFGFFIRNLNVEFLFKRHDKLNNI